MEYVHPFEPEDCANPASGFQFILDLDDHLNPVEIRALFTYFRITEGKATNLNREFTKEQIAEYRRAYAEIKPFMEDLARLENGQLMFVSNMPHDEMVIFRKIGPKYFTLFTDLDTNRRMREEEELFDAFDEIEEDEDFDGRILYVQLTICSAFEAPQCPIIYNK